MDLPRLVTILDCIHRGAMIACARDTAGAIASLCHEILNARSVRFLDDAPFEERRAQAVRSAAFNHLTAKSAVSGCLEPGGHRESDQ